MSNIKMINTPLTADIVNSLKAGDIVEITGTIYTARDAAHKRIIDDIDAARELPFDVKNSIVYYAGPAPTPPGKVIGSAGPTTSYRMDDFTPTLLDLGLTGMIGKGKRDDSVIDSMKKNGAIYFGAVGGAAAVISNSIKSVEIIAYEDLGPEAVRKLEVEKFPALVVIDCEGNNMYITGREKFKK